MARDTAYRWARPLKAWEYYVDSGLGGVDYADGLRWLREHVVAGRIRVLFDDIEITPTIARLLLEYRDLKYPDEIQDHPLPPDFLLNRPDIQRLLDRNKQEDSKRPGRPKHAGSLADADRDLVRRMNQMLSSFGLVAEYRRLHGREPPWPSFQSPTKAAEHLVEIGEVGGAGSDASKVRRLVRRYQKVFGDD